MFFATALEMPATFSSRAGEAVLRSTPTAFDAGFDHAAQRLAELLRRHVVLVLADADRLRVDLDELGERVLQAVRDRDGAAQRQVVVGVLRRRELGGRVDRSARLADDHVVDGVEQPVFAQHRVGEDLGLLRGRAVADRDQRDAVAADQPQERPFRLAHAVFAVRR